MSHFVRAFIVLLSIISLLSAKSLANPGDTTWVQAQNDVQLDYYNDFDTPVSFHDEITIRITVPGSQMASIALYDVQGRRLYATTNVISIDGNRFAAGVYTIVIRSAEQKLARKIIKL